MVRLAKEMTIQERENVANGNGKLYSRYLFFPEEMHNKMKMCAHIVLPKGNNIGYHAHSEDAELYCILRGEATVVEDGKTYILHAGDAVFTSQGSAHSISNNSENDVEFFAFILN